MRFDPGIYINIFPVKIPEEDIPIMVADRYLFKSLKELRQELNERGVNARVYAPPEDNYVYGYGSGARALESYEFQETTLRLVNVPKLTTHLIIEGLLDTLQNEGFELYPKKGRSLVYHPELFSEIEGGRIRIHRGYDLRSFFWKDPATQQLAFGIIVDIFWLLRDKEGNPLNMRQIKDQYGYSAVVTIAQVQGEYLPGTVKINTEVARQRFQEHILPFVIEHEEFNLPCGVKVELVPEPVRVILGGEEQ